MLIFSFVYLIARGWWFMAPEVAYSMEWKYLFGQNVVIFLFRAWAFGIYLIQQT
jgi:hypothetical protein